MAKTVQGAVVCSIVSVNKLTLCAFLHSVFDLTAAQMNMNSNLIWELIFYKFELNYNTTKDEGAIDYSTITWYIKIFHED